MPGIDPNLPFHPLNIAVLTVSDTRTEETDTSGALLVERLTTAGHKLAGKAIVSDSISAIQAQMRSWIADEGVDIIVSTGGTGFTGRDVTPEALEAFVFDSRPTEYAFAAVVDRLLASPHYGERQARHWLDLARYADSNRQPGSGENLIMDMNGSQRIEASPDTVWAALNDVDVLKACIPGCETINKTSDTDMDAKVTLKIGPVKAEKYGTAFLELLAQ